MLKTKRTILRNLQPADVPELIVYRNDPRCARYQRYGATTKEALTELVTVFAGCCFPSLEEEQHYAIVRDDVLLGDLTVFFNEADACFTLGITIAPAHQQQGYAFEVLAAVCARLQTQYPHKELVA